MGTGNAGEDSQTRHTTAITGATSSERVIAALSTPERLRVFAAIVLGARRPSEIAERSAVAVTRVAAALARLQKAGLVSPGPDGFEAESSVLAELARRQAAPRADVDYGTDDPAVTAVLNAFLADGRISSMPAHRTKRRVLLEHIVIVFEPGRRYTEAEVNAVLATFYDDTATLRRYLVDEQLLDRADGMYWRIGGWVDVL